MQIKSAANLLQKFGIHKDLTVKIKFIWIFSGKSLLFAQTSECKFGGRSVLPLSEGAASA